MAAAPKSHTGLLIVGIAGCAMVVLLPLAAWLGAPKKESEEQLWEKAHQAELVHLKSEAETLAIDGKLPESHGKYRELQELVAGRQIKDALIYDLIEQAKTDQDRVYAILLSKLQRQVMPAIPAAAPPAAQTPPYPASYDGLKGTPTQIPATVPSESKAAASTAPPSIPSSMPAQIEDAPPKAEAVTRAVPATTPALMANKPPRIPTNSGITDERIGTAIQRAVDFLLSNFNNDELKQMDGMANQTGHHGLNALCVYALLQAGQAIGDERLKITSPSMRKMIEKMKQHKMDPDKQTQAPIVYARALRSAALAVFGRPEDRAILKSDVDWLIKAHLDGAYTYDDSLNAMFSQGRFTDQPLNPRKIFADGKHNPDGTEGEQIPSLIPMGRSGRNAVDPKTAARNAGMKFPWDNSNSQYGLLGVWSGAEAGIEVPTKYWQAIEKHWNDCQTPEGQWYYNALQPKPTYGMTVAGIASLFIAHDWMDIGAATIKPGREPFTPALAKGLVFLEEGDNCMQMLSPETYYVSYNLYGLERVALASGFKYFGSHDWYRELTNRVVPVQWPNGAFGRGMDGYDSVAETAFTTLFLARGRHPILMNKLRFDGAWANRTHDLANLARFAGRELERPLNWQVVPIDRDWPDWSDSPILYIASNEPPRFTDQDIARLRGFVQAGGMLFTHADGGNQAFSTYVEKELAGKLFPAYELSDIRADDPLYTIQYNIKQPRPKLRGIWNGARWLMVHSPTDLAGHWQARDERSMRATFELPMNLFLYAVGRTDLRNRLNSPYIPPPTEKPTFTINIARLKYAGNWDPEPYAWTRFDRWMQWDNDRALLLSTVSIADLKPGTAAVAVLTGTAGYTPSDAEIIALRTFIQAGGWLIIDSCGGTADFARSIERDWLPKFSSTYPTTLPSNDPILTGGGPWNLDNLTRPLFRPDTIQRVGVNGVQLRMITLGKGRILYSPIDITSGLLGTNSLGILGYQTASAHSLVKNLIIQSQQSE